MDSSYSDPLGGVNNRGLDSKGMVQKQLSFLEEECFPRIEDPSILPRTGPFGTRNPVNAGHNMAAGLLRSQLDAAGKPARAVMRSIRTISWRALTIPRVEPRTRLVLPFYR